MLKQLQQIGKFIGHTPVKQLRLPGDNNVFAKLEFFNNSGSVKDRAAYNMIYHAIKSGMVAKGSVIVESSSGNLALALSMICRELSLEFIPVIDPNINPVYENYLRLLNRRVIKVEERDPTGGFLLTRINIVKELLSSNPMAFWTNQYENPYNYLAYHDSMGDEIEKEFDHLEFLFVSVSSGGTITGLSQRLKKKFKSLKVIAVDAEGSVIFGKSAAPRHIPGIGASIRSPIINDALIDEVVHVSQVDIIKGANELLAEQNLFCGGSSGACYHTIKKFSHGGSFRKGDNALFICPDKGDAYISNLYSPTWVANLQGDLIIDYNN